MFSFWQIRKETHGKVFFLQSIFGWEYDCPPPFRSFRGVMSVAGLLVGHVQNPVRFIELHNWSLPCYMYPLTENPRISPKQGFSWLMSQQSISDFLCNHFALVVWFLEGGEINTTVFKKCCCFVIALGSCLLLENGELFHFRVEEPQ